MEKSTPHGAAPWSRFVAPIILLRVCDPLYKCDVWLFVIILREKESIERGEEQEPVSRHVDSKRTGPKLLVNLRS